MPPFTLENIAGAILVGVIVSLWFNGWRSVGMGVFYFAWQMFTPRRPFIQDFILIIACLVITEFFFKQLVKYNDKTKKM